MPSSESSNRTTTSPAHARRGTGLGDDSRVDSPHSTSQSRFTVTATNSKDSATVSVLGPYWIQASWKLTAQTLSRAEKAFGRKWSHARPVLRVFGLSESDTTARDIESQTDIPIPGDAREWFAACPSGTNVEVQVGYLSDEPDGRFFPLAVSDPVATRSSSGPTIAPDISFDDDKADNREDSSGRIADSGLPDEVIAELQRLRTGAARFSLSIEAELRLTGSTGPGANICIGEATVAADSEGRFEYRHALENGRTVLPIDAQSSNGKESRAGVASADFNLRVLENADE